MANLPATDLEKVYRLLSRTMSIIAQPVEYAKGWSDEFARSETKKYMEKLQKTVKEEVNLTQFTDRELGMLGFQRWSAACGMQLVPLWAVKALRDGTKLYSIDGEVAIVGKDEIDNDVRFGCIPYGIMPEDKLICLARGCDIHTVAWKEQNEPVVAGTK